MAFLNWILCMMVGHDPYYESRLSSTCTLCGAERPKDA